jgi:hypothetical protein
MMKLLIFVIVGLLTAFGVATAQRFEPYEGSDHYGRMKLIHECHAGDHLVVSFYGKPMCAEEGESPACRAAPTSEFCAHEARK